MMMMHNQSCLIDQLKRMQMFSYSNGAEPESNPQSVEFENSDAAAWEQER